MSRRTQFVPYQPKTILNKGPHVFFRVPQQPATLGQQTLGNRFTLQVSHLNLKQTLAIGTQRLTGVRLALRTFGAALACDGLPFGLLAQHGLERHFDELGLRVTLRPVEYSPGDLYPRRRRVSGLLQLVKFECQN